VRYTCLVAILIALPVTADAQQRVVAGRNDRSAQTQSRSGQAQADRGPEQRQGDHGRGDQRQNVQRQNDQHQNNQRQTEQRTNSFLGPIGLPPAQAQRTPWWEQRQIPAWEQKQTPWWERQQAPSWERQQVPVSQMNNVARSMLDQERDARRLAKAPRPVHPIYRPGYGRPPIYYPLPPYGYYFPFTTYGYGYETSVTTAEVTPPPPEPETGFLRLEVEPRHLLQVFVDGLYLGTIADLGDDIELRLGARRIELRAPGYRTLIFDTRIEFDRTVVYRGVLEQIEETPVAREAPLAPQTREAPAGSRTMYLIPGCYMGNVEPTAAMLRPGCDIGKLTTIKP
jgi:hypothetical protein